MIFLSCIKEPISPVHNLPGIECTIQGVDYIFEQPTNHEIYDNRIDCHYISGKLQLDLIITQNNELYISPIGLLNDISFIINMQNKCIKFCNDTNYYPIKFKILWK